MVGVVDDVVSEHREECEVRGPPPSDAAIATLAARQHGVVAARQLRPLGVSKDELAWRVRRRRLIRLHRGVYAVGHDCLTRDGRWLAAVLACGPGAALSHRDGAAAYEVRPCHRTRIDVTAGRGCKPRAGIDVHTTRCLHPDDVTVTETGIPVTTLARTLIDLAEVVPAHHLRRALNEADRRELLDLAALHAALARLPGRKAHPILKAQLQDLYDDGGAPATRSTLEEDFLPLLKAAGLPRPHVNTRIEGVEVDACWPAARVAVELDSYTYHRGRRAFQDDRAKGRRLTIAGWRLLRYTDRDVTHNGHAIAVELRSAGVG